MPQPAEICVGTGISRPGVPSSAQAASMAMAATVVGNVMMSLSVMGLMGRHTVPASSRTAPTAASTSSSVLNQLKLNRTAPCRTVPRA